MSELKPCERKALNEIQAILLKCELEAENIFVREIVDGKWGSYSLSELGSKDRTKHVAAFCARVVKGLVHEKNHSQDVKEVEK